MSNERKSWNVQVFGNHTGGEISVIRSDNDHGKLSYGWFGDNKILIGGTRHGFGALNERVWQKLLQVASEIATELNEAEGMR
jgi:hypothetical protein